MKLRIEHETKCIGPRPIRTAFGGWMCPECGAYAESISRKERAA